MRRLLSMKPYAAVLALVVLCSTAPVQADPPETFEAGTGKYILVLKDARTDVPDPATGQKKAKEPDVAKHGGIVLRKGNGKRIIKLPTRAAAAMRLEENVAYLQRVWIGETEAEWGHDDSLATPVQLRAAAVPESQAELTWDTGEYLYDGSGNVRQIGTNTYQYDTLGRLKQAVVNGITETYQYDSFGNLVEKNVNGTVQAIPVDTSTNRLRNETYDVAGNVTTESGRPRYTYDSFSMISEKLRLPSERRRVLYGPDDERIAIMIPNGSPSRWKIRDFEGRVLREFKSDDPYGVWEWIEDYTYGAGKLLGGEREAYYEGKRHFHTDHLGTVRMITNQNRQRISVHEFSPFGVEQTDSTQEYNRYVDQAGGGGGDYRADPMKFTSHERDWHSWLNVDNDDYLDYMHARYYSPGWGRFLSVDPIVDVKRALRSPQLWNRYSYALNNPLVFTDPTGKTVYLVTYTTGNSGGDDEFRRAAMTRAADIQKQKGFDAKRDTVLVRGVKTKEDFAAAVKEANGLAPKFGKVGELSLYSHAGEQRGPVFHNAAGKATQFTNAELRGLNVNWEAGAGAAFFGCNTGANFIQAFANAQRVPTAGQVGYAYFSASQNERIPIGPAGPVYLIAAPGLHNGGFFGWWAAQTYTADAFPMIEATPDP